MAVPRSDFSRLFRTFQDFSVELSKEKPSTDSLTLTHIRGRTSSVSALLMISVENSGDIPSANLIKSPSPQSLDVLMAPHWNPIHSAILFRFHSVFNDGISVLKKSTNNKNEIEGRMRVEKWSCRWKMWRKKFRRVRGFEPGYPDSGGGAYNPWATWSYDGTKDNGCLYIIFCYF